MEPGTQLGPYEIVEPLGKGGMGEVYRAHDDNLRRDVAIKLLPKELADDPERLARLKREARSLASLNHPHIAHVYGFEEQDGTSFIVMELVEGQTLAKKLESGALPVEEALELAVQVAKALEAAHQRGIVHRDLKPGNVKVTPDGTVKVLDFGLAKPLRAETGDPESELPTATVEATRMGKILGTAPYMSPEQARGKPVDETTDVWAFGCVLYEMLAGKRAFSGETPSDTLAAVLKEDPDWEALAVGVPGSVRSLLHRCLRKDPDRRLQHVDDGRIELEDALAGLRGATVAPERAAPSSGQGASSAAVPPSGPAPSSGAPSSREVGSLGGPASGRTEGSAPDLAGRDPTTPRPSQKTLGVVGIVVVAMAAATFLAYQRGLVGNAGSAGPDEASVAVLPFEDRSAEGDNEYFSHGISETLINMLSGVEGLEVASRTSSFAFVGKDADIREIGEKLGVATVLEGSVAKSDDELRVITQLVDVDSGFEIWSEVYEGDLADIFAVQDGIATAITDALKVELVGESSGALADLGAENVEAYNLYLLGRHAWNRRTEEGILKSIERFENAIALDPTFPWAHVGLADAHCIAGFYDYLPPREAFPECRRAAERALELDPTLAEAHTSLGYVALYFDWDQAEAEREFRKAIGLDFRYAVAHQWYANALVTMGRFDDAAAEMSLGAQLDPLSLINAAAIGWVHYHAGEWGEALTALDVAIEMDPTFYLAHLWRGWTLERMSRLNEAIEATERAVELSDRSPNAVASLAYLYAAAGQQQAAERLLGELDAAGAYVPPYELAKVHLALDHEERGFDLLEQAHEDRSHSLVFLNVDPQLKRWRAHPRFVELVRMVGLE